tara:strand:- start:2300 stop:3265 length:966 start_codon:yes stop_codon:yes gene_type:complete
MRFYSTFYLKIVSILIVVSLFFSCENDKKFIVSNALFYTESKLESAIDSIGFLFRKHVIIVTGKDANQLYVYNAMNGELQKTINRENAYPNGVTTVNDELVLITERDMRHVAVFNASMDFIGTFGSEVLRQPYGITNYKQEDGSYKIFVTDSYDYNQPHQDRIISWELEYDGDKFSVSEHSVFGEYTLYQVESIMVDSHYRRLLVADEMEEHYKIAVLDLDTGEHINSTLEDFNFTEDPEGIALVSKGDNTGYWICTEQSKEDNRFHLFDRESLEYIDSLYLEDIEYTDGIATAYMHGNWYLYASDNDHRVGAFLLPEINH